MVRVSWDLSPNLLRGLAPGRCVEVVAADEPLIRQISVHVGVGVIRRFGSKKSEEKVGSKVPTAGIRDENSLAPVAHSAAGL